MSPCSTSTVARASWRARWSGVVVAPKSTAREPNRWLGASSRVTSWRARWTVSTTGKRGQSRSARAHAALRNETSNPALWATSTEPAANSRNATRAGSTRGASRTIASVMPVRTEMNAGIGWPGLTKVWNSPSTSPARTLTAPISVIPHSLGLPPVVSRSTTTKVTSDRGVPRSSRVPWTICMSARLGVTSDSHGEAKRRGVGDQPVICRRRTPKVRDRSAESSPERVAATSFIRAGPVSGR